MRQGSHYSLSQIESRICRIVAEQMGRDSPPEIHPGLRLVQDLHMDSLGFVELIMNVEDAFDISLPNAPRDPIVKTVFTRNPFRIGDLAELVYLRQGIEKRRAVWELSGPVEVVDDEPFTQLGGRATISGPSYEELGTNRQGMRIIRRRLDGMVCIVVPAAEVMLGTEEPMLPDEAPMHRARLDSFIIDREPVSTSAYCRFLNSIGPVSPALLREWFLLTPDEPRYEHLLVRFDGQDWNPLPGVERMPMMLISWYGANAYSLWANGRDWENFRTDEQSCLPSEAQWEYAARGALPRRFPWGDDDPTPQRMRYAQHRPGTTYTAASLPMADVNVEMGLSPFGLHHMAGNVWQWCRDWYAPDFYGTAESTHPNPVNRNPTGIRSERGGSWIGPAFLCRSSYRRGRVPEARGRCLGFRCVGSTMA